MAIELRAAQRGDVRSIVELTRRQRERLATWSPRYFRPRAGADEAHEAFLQFLVGSDDHDAVVIVDGGVVGFFVRVSQPHHIWIDDLVIADSDLWAEAVGVIAASTPPPWVTCVSTHDRTRISALTDAGLETVSIYYARSTEGLVASGPSAVPNDIDWVPGIAARHTFGGRPFDPGAPGALVVSVPGGGLVVGSASVEPPLYDPGGATTVLDQVAGPDRRSLVERAGGEALARGDAQLVLVVDQADAELHLIATELNFMAEVRLMGAGQSNLSR